MDPQINDFATRSFRDLADQDYIAARIAYRLELDQQFQWCALQAIEKYLKAILVYNRCSSKNLGHDLRRALARVKQLGALQFEVPRDVEEFVGYISDYGVDRYLSHPTYLRYGAFLTLDKAIWHIRRYCFGMHQVVLLRDGTEKDLFEINRRKATNPYFLGHPHKYRLFGGYLEKVIEKRRAAYEPLVWKNFFYGRARKRRIRNFTFRTSSVNPTHALHEEIFGALDDLVDFPAGIRKHYQARAGNRGP